MTTVTCPSIIYLNFYNYSIVGIHYLQYYNCCHCKIYIAVSALHVYRWQYSQYKFIQLYAPFVNTAGQKPVVLFFGS